MPAPEVFEVSPEDGSAYYLIPASEKFPAELVQVPLLAGGEPDWEPGVPADGFFGGGAVDWERGIEDDETRARLRAIEDRLMKRMES